MRAPWIAFALLLLALAAPARAHQASDAYLRASTAADGRFALQIDVALRDLDLVLDLDGNGDGKLSWGEVRRREAEIAAWVAAQLRVNEGRCALHAAAPLALDRKSDGTYAVLRLAGDCPAANATRLTYTLFRDVDPTHRGLLLLLDAQGKPLGGLRSLAPDSAEVPLALAASTGTAGDATTAETTAQAGGGFFGQGLHHILIGADHVLFLVCLLLPLVLGPGGGWRARVWPLLGLVTAFTIGHSITLGLASWRVVSLSPRIIEPLIAVTIALTALDNLKPVLGDRRVVAAFFFGLIHGFGFAGPLLELDLAPAEMALALLQFNLGVEAGQLVVVLIAMALLWPLGERGSAGPLLLRGGSVLAGALALVWLGERLFDFKVVPF